jgi:N-acetyl-gamma-glutamylphosphate reductase
MPRPPKTSHKLQESRDSAIGEALRYYGLSIHISSEEEFNHIKKFLSDDILYLDFVPQMVNTPTGIIIWSDSDDLSPGSVGSIEYQKSKFIRVVEFKDFFKL